MIRHNTFFMKKILFFLIVLTVHHAYGQSSKPGVKDTINKPQHGPPLVINLYSELAALDICKNTVAVNDPSLFTAGDTVMLIQMMGAVMDTSNTALFGTITDYKNTGNYEMNYVTAVSGNTVSLRNRILRPYDIPQGKVQLIRVPFIKTANYVGEYTCMPWDGSKGGVLVLNAQTVSLGDDIEVSGTGFRRGKFDPALSASSCSVNQYAYPGSYNGAAEKGECIAAYSQNLLKGKGSPANGGGGGSSSNSGGGGGGNAGKGGFGGYQTDTCSGAPFDNRGIGGKSLPYSSVANKIFMGGGGGLGHGETYNFGLFFGSGAGGGIAIIIAQQLSANGFKILANGGDAVECQAGGCHDGMDGGGGGGTVLLYVNQIMDNLVVETRGGKGADMPGSLSPGGKAGAGGGGGGGMFFINQPSLPANVTHIKTGGVNGLVTADANNAWGATPGEDGVTLFDLQNPYSASLFKPNIDSVRISSNAVTCSNFSFTGFGFTNTSPIVSWFWDFGDGNTANTQNTTHSYTATNTFTVKLVATDINGCKDSITTTVSARFVFADAGGSKQFCSNVPVSVLLTGAGTGTYAWTPAILLNDSTLQNPTATVNATTTFYLSITDNGCTGTDSVKISVNPVPVLSVSKSNDINCSVPFAKLNASGASQYLWTPAGSLNNSTIRNPVASPSTTTTYQVQGTNDNICFATDTITVVTNFAQGRIYLPNSFTPNGDGLNDCIGIKYYGEVQGFSFTIYNRYGLKVFESRNPSECWSGTYKGQPADPGGYIYYMTGKTVCGDLTKNGNLLLIR